MLNFFNRFKRFKRPEAEYVLLARYRTGDWFKQFTVTAYDSYEAARKFDNGDNGLWTRVSGAILKNPLLDC